MGIVLGAIRETIQSLVFRFITSAPRTSRISYRRQIAQSTIAQSESIVRSHAPDGATLDSTFLALEQLPPMDALNCPNLPPSEIQIINSDSFTAARDIIRDYPDAQGKTSVLNLASDEYRAGGWAMTLSRTQVRVLRVGLYSSFRYAPLTIETGGSPVLFIDVVRDVQIGILPMAERRQRLCGWCIFPWSRHLQG